MPKLLLGISGRVEAGEVLTAAVFNTGTGTSALTGFTLQWQVYVGGNWNNIGAPNAPTVTVPNSESAVGLSFRLAATPTVQSNESSVSLATSGAVRDTASAAAPVLTEVAASFTVAENAVPTFIDEEVLFNDPDSGNYGGGSLTIQNTNALAAGGDGRDVLLVRNQGVAAGQISVNTSTGQVFFAVANGNPVQIGLIDSAQNGNGADLKIAFNANATRPMVDRLIENLQFANTDDSPTTTRLLTIKMADPTGGTVQRVLQVNVTPVADAPVFTGVGAFTIDENQLAAGSVAALDPDRESSAAQGITYSLVTGTGSTDNSLFLLNGSTGALTFRTAPSYEGAHAPNYSVRVRATDSNSGVSERVVTVQVRNVNEAPQAVNLNAVAQEDGPLVSVAPAFSDPDLGDTHVITLATAGTVGAVTFAGGLMRYNTAGAFQSLRVGTIATDSFTYTVTDSGGLAVTRTVTVIVEGTNDAPVVPVGIQFGGQVQENGTSTANGILLATDVDNGDQLAWSASGNGTYGQLAMTSLSAWTYTLDNSRAVTQALAAGQSATESFTATVFDAYGGTAQAQIVVTVQGANDLPAIGGDFSGTVTDPRAGDVAGSLFGSDVDAGAVLAWNGNAAGQYGSFAIHATTGAWTFTPDQHAISALAPGEEAIDNFTVILSDGQGGSEQAVVAITVIGVVGEPGITGDTAASVSEDASGTGGALATFNLDEGTLSWSGSAAGTYGAFAIDADGAWTFTVDTAAAQALRAGEEAQETFAVSAHDGSGGNATSQVTVTVLGVNDAPVIAGVAAGEVGEDGVYGQGQPAPGTAVAQGILTSTDADGDAYAFSGSANGTYGTFSIDPAGHWGYALDNARTATQAMAMGQSAFDRFTVTLTDAFGGSAQREVAIQVHGNNDFTTVAAGSQTTGAVREDVTSTASGTLSVASPDPDAGDQLTWTGGGNGTYGQLAITPQGTWTYTLDNSRAATQGLLQGQVVNETFAVTLADQYGAWTQADVSIAVTGSSEPPVVNASSVDTGTVETASTAGQVLTPQGAFYSWQQRPGFATAMDANGRVLVLNRSSTGEVLLTRLQADGSADTSFGSGGSVYVAGSGLENIELAVDRTTGKIAVVGSRWGSTLDYTVFRFLDNGASDATLGGYGSVQVDIGGSDMAKSIMFDASGRMVITGQSSNLGPVVVRLTQSGSLDTAFGNGGKWVFTGENDGAWLDYHSLAMDTAGRLWAWGHTTDPNTNMLELRVFRYLANGNLDTSFATGGEYQFNNSKTTDYDLAIAPDGGFAFAWVEQQYTTSPAVLNVVRYGPNGQPLAGFGNGSAKVQFTLGNYDNDVTIEFDAQGRVVVGAATTGGADADMMLLRLTSTGARDTTFGVNGVASADFLDRQDYVTEIHFAANGDIVLAGLSTDAAGNVRMIAFQGLQSNGTIDTGFGGELDDSVGGLLTATDPDSSGALIWSGSANGVFGTLVVGANGQWVYEVDNARAATQAIAAGQTAVDTFNVTVADDSGSSTLHEVVVTIVGSPAA